LREQTLTLVGVQNAEPAQLAAATAAGLASFAPSATTPIRRVTRPSSDSSPTAEPASAPPSERAPLPVRTTTKIVTEPVRSGTQIYARGGDLIVTAAVSPGAEVMADGNIHVYGRLRGRALAGAAGDADARIFCTRLEAELVSIAGRYLVSEQLPAEHQGGPAQIALLDDALTITRT
jgi:septum site-determining protein MinC